MLAFLGATGYKSHAAFPEHPLLQKNSWASPAPRWSLGCHWLGAQMSSATHGSPKQACRVQQPCWKVGSCNTPPVSCVRSSHRGRSPRREGPPHLSLWGREGWLSMGSPCRTTGYSQAESVVVVLPKGCVTMNMGTSFGNDCLKAAHSLHHPIPCLMYTGQALSRSRRGPRTGCLSCPSSHPP